MSRHSEQLRQRIAVRMLQDVILSADVAYWLRRARDFEDALPRSGDYLGEAGVDGAQRIAVRLQQAADDCRSRAEELAAERDDIA